MNVPDPLVTVPLVPAPLLPDQQDTQLQQLRQQFDHSFSQPPPAPTAGRRNFILLAAGGMQFAVELLGLKSLEHGLPMVPLPSDSTAVLGVAALKGMVLPVFDLGLLLGGAAIADAWWNCTAMLHLESGAGDPIGLAFEHLLQFARVDAKEVYPAADGSQLRFEQTLYPVVVLADVVSQLTGTRHEGENE